MSRKQGDKEEDKVIADRLAAAIKSMDISTESTDKIKEAISAERHSVGLSSLFDKEEPYVPPEEDLPDLPSCDACGKDFSGSMKCSQCHSAYYCSKECQRHAWKKLGHKQKCDSLEEECKIAGEETVALMNNTSYPPLVRIQKLDRLDGEGAYKQAKSAGLNDAIYNLLKEDIDHLEERWKSHLQINHVANCNWIFSTLFRGHRISHAGRATTRYTDGARVKSYVCSKDDAFETFWLSSMKVIHVVCNAKVSGPVHERKHALVHGIARDVVAAWTQVWNNSRASKAILYRRHKSNITDPEITKKAQDRVKFVANTTKECLAIIKQKENRDINSVLEGYLNQLSAMLSYRCREYKIFPNEKGCIMEKFLKFRGIKLQMYRQVAVPLGEGTIKKGAALTNEESQIAMMNARR